MDWEETFVGDVILPFKFCSSLMTILAGEVSFEGLGFFVGNPELAELANFAQLLLRIVVNQAGCEQLFSDLKNKQSDKQTHLRLEKLEKWQR